MTPDPKCARPGCGHPRKDHCNWPDGTCIGRHAKHMQMLCGCPRYIAASNKCSDCNGIGAWGQTSPRGIGGQQITECRTCNGTGIAPQAEEETKE